MYKLFTFSRSSTAWRARIALNLKNIKPENVYLHLLKGEHRNEQYKKINPNMVSFLLNFSECSFIGLARRTNHIRVYGHCLVPKLSSAEPSQLVPRRCRPKGQNQSFLRSYQLWYSSLSKPETHPKAPGRVWGQSEKMARRLDEQRSEHNLRPALNQ
jgi:hypothetical protein